MKHSHDTAASGQQLIADFQSVLLSRATAEAATMEAERTESQLMQQLTDASRGVFLNPNSLQEVGSGYVVHASLDAHVKKVQAEQLQSMTQMQIAQLIADDQTRYTSKKVRVTSNDSDFQPFDALWFDQQTGYRSSPYKKHAIEGYIEEISFDKNMLVIKPKHLMRLINNSLQFYLVYVINPATFKPAVEISLL